MTKVTLNNVGSLIDATTAANTINANTSTIAAAFDNTLSRDGSQPNAMNATIDMNGHAIANLPSPISGSSPLRLTDASILNGGGTISTIPVGGTTNQGLVKASNADFDLTYSNVVSSVGLSLPSDFNVTGSPVSSSGTLTATFATPPTGTGAIVRNTSPTINTPTLSSPIMTTPILGIPASGNLVNCSIPAVNVTGLGAGVGTFLATPTSANLSTAVTDETGTGGALVFANNPTITLANGTGLPISTGVSGLAAGVATFLGTPSSANLAAALTNETGTGSVVFNTSPTLTTPNIVGTVAIGDAAAGSVGEYLVSDIASGSATALTTSTAKTITSITLTPGDWDVSSMVGFVTGATTSITLLMGSVSLVTNTFDTTNGRFTEVLTPAQVPGAGFPALLIKTQRFNVSSSTTVFLIAYGTFTVSTLSAFGNISARRIR